MYHYLLAYLIFCCIQSITTYETLTRDRQISKAEFYFLILVLPSTFICLLILAIKRWHKKRKNTVAIRYISTALYRCIKDIDGFTINQIYMFKRIAHTGYGLYYVIDNSNTPRVLTDTDCIGKFDYVTSSYKTIID